MARNFVFLVHAGLAAVAAFILVSFPNGFARMAMAGWNLSSPMAPPAEAFARMAGVGAILVVLVTSIARHSASARVRWAARIAVLVVSILMAVVAALVPFQPLGVVLLAVHLFFAAAYLVGGVAPPPQFFNWNPPRRYLDVLYMIHAGLAAMLAFWLLLYPASFTDNAMGVPWTATPIEMAEITLTFARPAAIGAILVVLSTLLAVRAASVRVRWAALLAMLTISLVAVGIAWQMIPLQPLMIVMLVAHGVLAAAYVLIDIFYRHEI
jgi:hypothetical protein